MMKDIASRRRIYYTLITRNGTTSELHNYSTTERQSADCPLDAQSDSEGTEAVVDLVTDPEENSGQKV